MLIYHLNLLLILGLAYPLCIRKPSWKKKLIYLGATFGFMFFLVCARDGIGHDFVQYRDYYYEAASASFGEVLHDPSGRFEVGYRLLMKFISFFGLSHVGMYAVLGFLCLAPVAWFIYRYSPNIWISTWLFATLTFFYSTMNFVRQDIAMCILLLGYPLLRRRNLYCTLGYLGVILVAFSFHKSALLMLPILCVCYFQPRWRLLGAYGIVTLLAYAFSRQILDLSFKILPFDYFEKYNDTIYLNVGLGYHFLIIPALVLILVLCCKKRILELYPKDGALVVNMTVYGALIWLFITHHFILERFSLFVWIYILLSVPMAVECLKPSAEDYEQEAALREKVKEHKANKTRDAAYLALNKRYMDFSERIHTRRNFYWCLIAVLLIATFCYNVFGMTDGSPIEGRMGFHGVFPYRSLIEPLNRLP